MNYFMGEFAEFNKRVKLSKPKNTKSEFDNFKSISNSFGVRGGSKIWTSDGRYISRIGRSNGKFTPTRYIRYIDTEPRPLLKIDKTPRNAKSKPVEKKIIDVDNSTSKTTQINNIKPKSKLINKYTLGGLGLLGVGGLSYATYKLLQNKNKKRR